MPGQNPNPQGTANITASVEPLLKIRFIEIYHDIVFRDHVVMGMVKKKALAGKYVQQAQRYGNGGGRGHTFANAQTNASDASRTAFQCTQSWTYGYQDVLNTDIRAANGDMGTIYDLWADCQDAATRACGDDLELILIGDGFGIIGTIGSNSGGGPYVLTLSTAQQAINFEPNMVLVSAVANNSASLDTGTATVTAINVQAGTVTVSANGGWTPTNTHVLSVQGNKIASATAQLNQGLGGWLPLTAPVGGDNFFGVDRSASVVDLAGWRLLSNTGNLATNIKALANQMSRRSGSKPDLTLMSFNNIDTLENIVDNKTRYPMPGRDVDVFYESIQVGYAKGRLNVVGSPVMYEDRFFNLMTSTWNLFSAGNEPVTSALPDAQGFISDYNADSRQIRMIAQTIFTCEAVGWNGVGQVF
jgi:hypothetical protein